MYRAIIGAVARQRYTAGLANLERGDDRYPKEFVIDWFRGYRAAANEITPS